MTVTTLAAAALTQLIPGWRVLARRSWCANQRRRLQAVAPNVLWLHDGEKMPWAFWGEANGFFEVEWANHLPYLRAAATVE